MTKTHYKEEKLPIINKKGGGGGNMISNSHPLTCYEIIMVR